MAEYPRHFRLVEVQQTFYDPPQEQTLLRWRNSLPANFEFTLKAWQLITHLASSSTYRRLRRPLEPAARAEAGGFRWNATVQLAWKTTLRCARLLQASCVLFQCPASFKATAENAAAMRNFFGGIGPTEGMRYLWEPRGPWPDALVAELCAELNLTHVVDPLVRASVTPESSYYRLHGLTGARHVYSDRELERLAELVPPEGTSYFLFNNLPRVGDAQRFMELMARKGAP